MARIASTVRKNKPQGGKKTAFKKPIKGKINKKDIVNNKRKTDDKDKLVFTRENINSHLLTYNENPEGYKLNGMVTYIFKEYKDEPSSLLSKIKILTMNKKVEVGSKSIIRNILNNLFALYDMKGSFHDNLFSFLNLTSYLSILATELYFESSMETEEFEEIFNKVCDEIIKVMQPKAYASFEEFDKAFMSFDEISDLKNARTSVEADSESKSESEDEAIPAYTAEDRKNNHVDKWNDDMEQSSFSLVSLNDDEEIEKMDYRLGSIFRGDGISEDNKNYASKLMVAIKQLLTANYIFNIELFKKLLYIDQFAYLYQQSKHAIRTFVDKVKDKKRIFRMFQIAALQIPQVYKLYKIMQTTCGVDYDSISFMDVAITNGDGEYILQRVDNGEFYRYYKKDMGLLYDEFLVGLIGNENSIDTLKRLSENDLPEEAQEAIKISIDRVEHRAKKSEKKNDKKTVENVEKKVVEKAEKKVVENVENKVVEKAEKKVVEKKKAAEKIIEKSENQEVTEDVEEVIEESMEENSESDSIVEEPNPSKRSLKKEATNEKSAMKEEAKKLAKKSFRERIGSKIADEKEENKKKFRMKNLKEKTKAKKIEKEEMAEKEANSGPKITKRALREESTKALAKKGPAAKKTKKN